MFWPLESKLLQKHSEHPSKAVNKFITPERHCRVLKGLNFVEDMLEDLTRYGLRKVEIDCFCQKITWSGCENANHRQFIDSNIADKHWV